MRLIFVNRFFYPDESATSQLLSDLAFELAAAGAEVHVVTSPIRYEALGPRLPALERLRGVTVHRPWTSGFGRSTIAGRSLDYASFYAAAAFKLLRLARPGDVIVAKTDPPLISSVAWLCAALKRAKLVNWVQDVFPEAAQALRMKGVAGPVAALLRTFRNRSLSGARMNVAVGDLMESRLRAQAEDAPIRVIPNWGDGAAIRPLAPHDNPLRRDWGLGGAFVVGYSGNLGRAHHFDAMLEAAARLRDDDDVRFVFIGGGHGRGPLGEAIRSRALSNVALKPHQPRSALGLSLTLPDLHLISLRPELEGLVLPSKFYGAAAAGRPIAFIGSPDGELSREIRRLGCGRSFAAGDGQGLADFIRELKSKPDLAADMGRRARYGFEAGYDKPRAVAAWSRLLKAVEAER